MAKGQVKISKQMKDDMREEYVNSNKSQLDISKQFKVGHRTVNGYAAEENWVELRHSARSRALQAAKENLKAKLSESMVTWDSDVLDMIAQVRHEVQRILDDTGVDINGEEKFHTITQLQRLSETISKLNTVQRQVTERDIQKIQTVDDNKVEEMRELLLGSKNGEMISES